MIARSAPPDSQNNPSPAGAIRDGWRVWFSRLPLRMLTYLGLAIALSAFMEACIS